MESFYRFLLILPCSALTHRVLYLVINEIMIKYIKSPEVEHISHIKCIDLKIHPGDTGKINIPQQEMSNSIILLTDTNNFKGIFH